MPRTQKPPRCDYCNRPSVVWLAWTSWYSRCGSRRALHMKSGACAEHENCVAFASLREIQKDAAVFRASGH